MTTYCWPIDTTACPDFDTFDTPIQDMAKDLAAMAMRMLTGYSRGSCPVTVRPCSVPCVSRSASWRWEGGTFVPHINSLGLWTNATCGCSWACGHDSTTSVFLPGVVSAITAVKIDGVVLDASKYRVDNGNILVRTDGLTWPTTQDMTKDDDQVGTWSVRYTDTPAVDTLGQYAAGLLACEYAKSLTNDKSCSLPKSATSITRQGITMTLTPGAFPDGLTGIHIVDSYLLSVNPSKLKRPPSVISPDTLAPTVTTWRAP